MGKIVGIDLGTTNSCVAVMEGNTPKVIANQEGALTTPSVVAVDDKGHYLVGQIARRQASTHPESTVFSPKRFIGQKFSETQSEMKRMPYAVHEAANGDTRFRIRGKSYAPPEISAQVLRKLKEAVEAYLGESVTEAVVSVPAHFNDSQRQATRDAGRIAGLDVTRIINSTTATAMVYGLDKKDDQVIAVYDFGGGTFDISVLEVGEHVVEVISATGDVHLGGDNIDERVIDYLVSEFKKSSGIDVSSDKMAMQRLREAAENAKVELSSTQETEISLPCLAMRNGPRHLQTRLSRTTLEQLADELIERTLALCRRALDDAGKSAKDVDEVVLVGGSTRMPKIIETVRRFFGKEPNRTMNPDEVVAVGAAVQAGILGGTVKNILLLDVTPFTLGVETLGGEFTPLIKRNTTIPARKTEAFSTAEDKQTSVEIHVLEGERGLAMDNRTIGKFHLEGIPEAPRGEPLLEVTFDIDTNGILKVSARDTATNKAQRVTVTSSSGLGKDELDRMVKDAESHANEDNARREAIEAKNHLDTLIYQTQRSLDEFKEKLPAGGVSELEAELTRAKRALKSEDATQIKAASEALTKASHKLAEAMYRQAGGYEADARSGKSSVVDAEVVDD